MENFENKQIEEKVPEEKKENVIQTQNENEMEITETETKSKIENIEEKVEAIIFLSKEMITVKELAQFYDMENFEMEEVLYNLRKKRRNTGINLKIENGIGDKEVYQER